MPKKDIAYGRSLIKAHKKRTKVSSDGFRHTSDINDGEDCCKLNLKSITEQTNLQEFLETANLNENYQSESKVVTFDNSDGILSEEQQLQICILQDENKDILCIPRRPEWDKDTSKEVLDEIEKEAFLIWRRKLVELQNIENINLTPFEKNLEVWRQLWRVIERSNVIVQIVDARNPLLFRCTDLEQYVNEVDESKVNILLLNKADLLTETQRKCWCEYFDEVGIRVVFFSALQQMERPIVEINTSETPANDTIDLSCIKNQSKVLSREELVTFFKIISTNNRFSTSTPTVGLVGYPNVGKSSTINAILMSKKVSVSATPGKTKHFQTLNIDQNLCLCDCPGLVFPNFVSTKADMVINGILPIDQLTDWTQPISLITHFIPRKVLESTYSIFIPLPTEDRSPDSPPTAEEFLNPYGFNRGYMSPRGLPDNARSARYVLKDYVNGKLLYCHAPPNVKQEDYHTYPEVKSKKAHNISQSGGSQRSSKPGLSEADVKFFSKMHIKGGPIPKRPETNESSPAHKPWRKHNNRNKHEKLRRIYKNPYDD